MAIKVYNPEFAEARRYAAWLVNSQMKLEGRTALNDDDRALFDMHLREALTFLPTQGVA